jgi:hypothetical protein
MQDLITNYELKQTEISQLYSYVNSITAENKVIDIEFESDKIIAKFYVVVNGNHIFSDSMYNGGGNENRNLDIESQYVDNLLNRLGWTMETLRTLKQKLDNANCISVASGEPITIGYQRSDMGMYFYKVFNQTLSDSLKNKYNDGCTYIFYKNNIVLEYRGGVIGPQCF